MVCPFFCCFQYWTSWPFLETRLPFNGIYDRSCRNYFILVLSDTHIRFRRCVLFWKQCGDLFWSQIQCRIQIIIIIFDHLWTLDKNIDHAQYSLKNLSVSYFSRVTSLLGSMLGSRNQTDDLQRPSTVHLLVGTTLCCWFVCTFIPSVNIITLTSAADETVSVTRGSISETVMPRKILLVRIINRVYLVRLISSLALYPANVSILAAPLSSFYLDFIYSKIILTKQRPAGHLATISWRRSILCLNHNRMLNSSAKWQYDTDMYHHPTGIIASSQNVLNILSWNLCAIKFTLDLCSQHSKSTVADPKATAKCLGTWNRKSQIWVLLKTYTLKLVAVSPLHNILRWSD